jgi:membrane associated rhomboid family serine protease
VTYILIGVCVLLFLPTMSGETSRAVFDDLATVGFGASSEGQPIGVGVDQYWRLITGGFLHDGIVHIAFNMYILYWLGTMLEPALGHVRFAALYFASLLAGSFGAIVADPNVLTVGASGAVFGLMAAAFVFQRARGIDPWRSGIGPVILLNLALPFVFTNLNISIGGHIGGLIGGAIAALAMERVGAMRRGDLLPVLACVAVGIASVVGAIIVSNGEAAQFGF